MQYKIIVDKQSRTNPSKEKKQYIIDIEELRCKGDVADSLVITKDEDYVMRRLELTEYHVLNVLDTPKKEPIENLNIELFEGDNYIYLIDMVGNRFYAEYLIKNDFTDTYVTTNQMQSAINESAGQIELTVNQKLTGYSTTQEMNSAINLKADSITSSVNNTFKNYSTTTQMNSAINQKAGSIIESVSKTYSTKDELATEKSERVQSASEINQTVSKKVGKDEIISSINQTAESTKINANKIELSANDILNLLAGNEINLKSKNITISSDNFKVTPEGILTAVSAILKNITIDGGKILLSGKGNFFIGTKTGDQVNIDEDEIAMYDPNGDTLSLMPTVIWIASSSGSSAIQPTGIDTQGYVHADGEVTGSNISSDRRLKKNIKNSKTNAIDTIRMIKHRNFDWKKDNKHVNTGYIAQELEKIDSNFILKVPVNKKGKIVDYKYYINLLPILATSTKAIQELAQQNDNQNKRIKELENKVETLTKGVDK